MNDEPSEYGASYDIQARYENDMSKASKESWAYAFLGLLMLCLGANIIHGIVTSEKARIVALGVTAFCCVAALVRFVIKWVWQSRLKTKYAEKVMLS